MKTALGSCYVESVFRQKNPAFREIEKMMYASEESEFLVLEKKLTFA